MALNWETAKIKLRQYASLLKLPNFEAANIKCVTVVQHQKGYIMALIDLIPITDQLINYLINCASLNFHRIYH